MKNVVKTIIISVILFLFIGFLGYVIYVFGIYDKKNLDNYVEEFNSGNFSYVYKNIKKSEDKLFINKDKFNEVMDLMYDKNSLKEIYDTYYSKEYLKIEYFFDDYYFGYTNLDKKNFSFNEVGETSLFKRKKIYYENVNIVNNKGVKSKLGIFKDINFYVDGNGTLTIDDIEIKCNDGVCNVESMFGGLHKVKYEVKGKEYFCLINVGYDTGFNLDELLILVKDNSSSDDYRVNNINLENGKYIIKKCHMDYGCANRGTSYLDLREDGTANLYTYITIDMAGDDYYGVYKIENGFLYLSFYTHYYKVHDYDTKQITDIVGNADMEMVFKIVNNKEFKNDDYTFYRK